MSTLMRSLTGAILALVFLTGLIAPLSIRMVEGDVSETSVRHDAGVSTAIVSDGSSAPLPFIKPHVAESVVAERGFEETEPAISPAPRSLRPSPVARPEAQFPVRESETRRSLLRVYRL